MASEASQMMQVPSASPPNSNCSALAALLHNIYYFPAPPPTCVGSDPVLIATTEIIGVWLLTSDLGASTQVEVDEVWTVAYNDS